MNITFTVPGVPVAQPRQRHRVAGKGDKVFVQNFTPATHPVQAFKLATQMAARAAYQGPPLAGPLRFSATFLLARPAGLPKKLGPGRLWAPKKPDCDNFLKASLDSLNGTLYKDDKQVVIANVRKMYAAADEQPCVLIEVNEL